MQRLVPEKYKTRLGEAVIDMKELDKNLHLHPKTVLLKEPGLYCFLLRCKRDEAKPFTRWAVETVLPREVRKLASVIEEKDAALALLNDDLKNCEYGNVALQAQRDVYQAQLQKYQDTVIHLRTRYLDHARDSGKDNIITLSSLYRNRNCLQTISFMICHIMLRGYNDIKGYVKLRWFN